MRPIYLLQWNLYNMLVARTIELKHLNQCWTLEGINPRAMKVSAGQNLGMRGNHGEIQPVSPLSSLGLNDRNDRFTDLGFTVLRPHIL